MPALLSAIIFFIFAGIASTPQDQPPGGEFIPGIKQGSQLSCLPADASQGTATLFGIPKPNKDNVPFVAKPNPHLGRFNCAGADGSCDVNPWDGQAVPEVADYVTVAQNVVLTKIWPDNDTTRLAKQILPRTGEPYYRSDFDNGDFRDRIYRPTCNDWCAFTPPDRTPALPYGGTFFCEFIFFYNGQNTGGATGARAYAPKDGEPYPDDTSCDPNDPNLENCPVFDVLIRKGAAVPEVAGGAAPGSEVTPLRCDLQNPTASTPTPIVMRLKPDDKIQSSKSKIKPLSPRTSARSELFASSWIETINGYLGAKRARAQTESFINLRGNHSAQGEWIYNTEKVTYSGKLLSPAEGRQKIPEPKPIIFRGNEYEAYFNLLKSLVQNEELLYLVTPGAVDAADAARQANNPDYRLTYLEFRRSPEIHPGGKTLQLGTFGVVTAKGWWELFPEESKPAIYLYPEEPMALNVRLDTKGELTVSDPHYNPQTGWNIIAHPNGLITEYKSEKTYKTYKGYPYLYYEAILDRVHIDKTGFLVRGSDLRGWFTGKLPELGLTKLETADFIQYWMSRLDESQPYYFIHFLSQEQIEDLEPLTVSEISPDTEIRIRPYFKPLSAGEAEQLSLEPQELPDPPEREGFVLVEWGGILVP